MKMIRDIANDSIIESIYNGVQQDEGDKKEYRETVERVARESIDKCYNKLLDMSDPEFSDKEWDFLVAAGACELVGFILGFKCAMQFRRELQHCEYIDVKRTGKRDARADEEATNHIADRISGIKSR